VVFIDQFLEQGHIHEAFWAFHGRIHGAERARQVTVVRGFDEQANQLVHALALERKRQEIQASRDEGLPRLKPGFHLLGNIEPVKVVRCDYSVNPRSQRLHDGPLSVKRASKASGASASRSMPRQAMRGVENDSPAIALNAPDWLTVRRIRRVLR
jgi:hypothetical protein